MQSSATSRLLTLHTVPTDLELLCAFCVLAQLITLLIFTGLDSGDILLKLLVALTGIVCKNTSWAAPAEHDK